MQDIQVMLKSDAHHASIRSLKVLVFFTAVTHFWSLLLTWTSAVVSNLQSDQVSRLVKVHGIIISATAVKAKATKVCLQCRGCRNIINNIPLPPGLQGYALPRKCNVWVPDLDQEHVRSCAEIWVIFILFSFELNRWSHWDTRSHSRETCSKETYSRKINDRWAFNLEEEAGKVIGY